VVGYKPLCDSRKIILFYRNLLSKIKKTHFSGFPIIFTKKDIQPSAKIVFHNKEIFLKQNKGTFALHPIKF
jgi:hypothetical protein